MKTAEIEYQLKKRYRDTGESKTESYKPSGVKYMPRETMEEKQKREQ